MPSPPRDTAYSDTPLAKKLGILTTRAETSKDPREIAILGAPDNFVSQLGDLPSTIRIRKSLSPNIALAIVFIRTLAELDAALDLLQSGLPPRVSAWLVRPKTHHKPGFNENDVRNGALARGLVDYKICSVDADWSGIKFAWRKSGS
jgi:hypothetical protein